MADLFISYSRHDLAFTRRLAAGLESRGKDVWVDLDDILPSAPWMAEIRVAIAEADAVVVVLSPTSVASSVCESELQAAVDLNKRLIPVVAQATPIEDVPATLAALNFLDFSNETGDPAFEATLSRLIDALDTDLDAVHLHTRLLLRTAEWEDSSHDPARLLRGRQLSEAEGWLELQGDRTPAPTSGQVGLIMASRRAAIRRQRGSMAVAATVLLGLIGLSIFSVVQWHAAVVQRGQATSRADAAESQVQLQINPPRALDLALQSLRAAKTTQAQTALRSAVATVALRAVLPPTKRAVEANARAADGGGGEGQVAFDPSGSFVVVAHTSGDVEVWRWRARSGRGSYRDPYRLDVSGAHQVAFIDNGQKILVLDTQRRLIEWNWRKGPHEVLRRGLRNAVLNQSGDFLAAPSGTTVKVTHAISGKPVAVIPTGRVLGSAFSPDGSLLATWSGSSPVSVWQVSTGHFNESVDAMPEAGIHNGAFPVAINAQDDRVAVGTDGNAISVYSLAEPTATPKVLEMTAPPGASAESGGTFTAGSLVWSPDGEELATGGYDHALRVWSGNLNGQTFVGPVGDGAGGVAFSPDAASLASSDSKGRATVWDWGAVNDDSLSVPGGVPDNGATMSPDGRMVAYAANPSGTDAATSIDPIQLWDWRHFKTYFLTSVDSGLAEVHLAFSPNGQWLAVSSDGAISIWDVDSRRRLAFLPLSGQDPVVSDVTFDRTGRWLSGVEATDNGLSKNRASLVDWHWAASSSASRLTKIDDEAAIDQVESTGSIRFVAGRDYLSWGGSSHTLPHVIRRDVLPAGTAYGATFFDHGQQVMFEDTESSGRPTDLVDLRTGSVRNVLGQYEMEGGYVHSPDGKLLAGTALNGDEVVWDGNPSEVPAAIQSGSNGSTVTLAPHVLLIAEPNGLVVVPDANCGPLNDVVALAQSLLIQPLALAESVAYND